MTKKSVKVIFDTNVWISFLIGKRLAGIKKLITRGDIKLIYTEQLLAEIKRVTQRASLRKYFPEKNVIELLEFMETIGHNTQIEPIHFINRDPKDNFLLDLIAFSNADYLVTGDKDLLLHNPFKSAKILTPSDFQKEIANIDYSKN
ncbi:putative toxin-antitoxin system toxin component, PIN family [Aequorivita marina]|uniref:putative toxin-antitoxin system toxin component, PIN family n=1 Tax=Aequorivita marina TaxID=3073654 RepID=UPI002875D8CD|nr:putative toxin-antitoxin system toxin component, PIN family [Aequorivita sp. S2608]MDS1296813.1 putative toxin-antitoxin system toxin component, PIN family [Aequorivita sp. S2608]